jgi:transcriptional regulator with GAF, ATPase, and Fis domain
LLHRNQTRYLQAIQPDGSIRSQSLSAWSLELGLPAATLRWRVRAGWSDAEVLGQVEHPRDRQQEQAASALEATNVVVVEEGRIVGRSEAARRLGIKKASLVYRLRQYRRPDGRQAEVSFVSLAERSRQIPRD